jgi:hypothetical protein
MGTHRIYPLDTHRVSQENKNKNDERHFEKMKCSQELSPFQPVFHLSTNEKN